MKVNENLEVLLSVYDRTKHGHRAEVARDVIKYLLAIKFDRQRR